LHISEVSSTYFVLILLFQIYMFVILLLGAYFLWDLIINAKVNEENTD